MKLSKKAHKMFRKEFRDRFIFEPCVIEYSEKQKQFHKDYLYRSLFDTPTDNTLDWKIIFIGTEEDVIEILNNKRKTNKLLKYKTKKE